jgi:hypothetical protein
VPFTFTPDNPLNVGSGGTDDLGQFYTIGHTYLISPDTVNAARIAVNRTAIHRLGPDFFSIPDLGVQAYSYLPHHSVLSVNGAFSLGGTTESEATFRTTTYQISDDINMVRGAHQIAFGATVAHWRSNTYAHRSSTGQYTFNADITGLGMADFLLGKLASIRQSGPNGLLMSQWYLGIYGQDAWRLSPRLTVNAGLRWEPFFPQVLRDGHIINFDYDRMVAGLRSTVYLNAPPGFYYPGDPGFPGNGGLYTNWKSIGPRVGLGWDVTGDGKTSVRASYGLSYDFVNGQYHINNLAPPWANEVIYSGGTFDDPWAGYPGGNPFPFDPTAKTVPFLQGGIFVVSPYDMKTTYVQQWSLAVQRQLPADVFLSVDYKGNGTRHLWISYPLNPAIYIPGSNCTLPNGRFISGTCSTTGASNVNQRRLLSLYNYQDIGQYVGPLDTRNDGGTASYHGMSISANRRTGNLNLSGNYTWSHCIGQDASTSTPGPNGGTVFLNIVGNRSFPTDRDSDRANCGTDRRHLFNSTVVAETPQFSNRVVRAIASGWRVSNIYRKSSGSYLSVAAGSDASRMGGNTGAQRAVQLSADVYASGKPTGPRAVYLNPGTFAVPATGTLAPNRGLRNIVGPGTWQWDASVSRIFRIDENKRIEARVEAYNVPNSFRASNPSTSITGSTFGQINNSAASRDMQFALKYVF